MKRREIEFTEQSYAALVAIALWTIENFGARQAQSYKAQLLARCHAIAGGRVVHRSCRMACADSLSDDLRYATCGRHYVIFAETDHSIRVIDFLHQSADIARRLGA